MLVKFQRELNTVTILESLLLVKAEADIKTEGSWYSRILQDAPNSALL
jgi:hypothetical protein